MSIHKKSLTWWNIGTSRIDGRINAINQLKSAGYKIGILIAPIILIDNWKMLYENLLLHLCEQLNDNVKNDVFFELIFMTYSYIHRAINQEMFPNAINLYNENLMTARGPRKIHL